MKAVLETWDLCYTYNGETLALNHVTVAFYKGERVAVLGNNGAGKSTFFSMLNGLRKPDSGGVKYNGAPIGYSRKELIGLRQKVGEVFQEADRQIIAATVEAEVSFGPMNLKLPREEAARRTSGAIRYMNLDGYERRSPHCLSGGEKKRVSIAGVIAMEPEILLFDEPTASLDPYHVAQLEETLERMHREGRTLVISTHDVEFAYRWADRVLVFHQGRLAADGTPEQVFSNQELLKQACLKQPVLWQAAALLAERGLLAPGKGFPKTVKELSRLL